MTKGMLEEKLPGTAVRNISELIRVGLDLTAANGTKIPFIGWADVRVRLPSCQGEAQDVHFPFLITIDRLEMQILGYNVIEELVKMSSPADEPTPGFNILSAFKAGFEDGDEKQLEALINLIQAPSDDYICCIRTSERETLSSRKVKSLMCRAGPILGLCQVRCQYCLNLTKCLSGRPVSRFMKR